MRKVILSGLVSCLAAGFIFMSAADCPAQSPFGSMLKSAAQAAGQAAVLSLSPQAQKTVDEAKKLTAPAKQENFLIVKAKEYLAAGNYQSAFDLGNYVLTTLNSKSVDAKTIMSDAKAALLKMAQNQAAQAQQKATAAGQQTVAGQKAVQIQSDAKQTAEGVRGLLGTFGTQKN